MWRNQLTSTARASPSLMGPRNKCSYLSVLHGGVQAGQGVLAAGGGRDGNCEAVLGGVVDHRADPPDPTAGGLELGEVHLPDPVALGGRVAEHPAADRSPGLAIGPEPARQQQTSAA